MWQLVQVQKDHRDTKTARYLFRRLVYSIFPHKQSQIFSVLPKKKQLVQFDFGGMHVHQLLTKTLYHDFCTTKFTKIRITYADSCVHGFHVHKDI